MLRFVSALLAALLLAIFASCGGDDASNASDVSPPDPQGLPQIALTGASFEDGGTLPPEYTCASQTAKSPNILWHGVPEATQSLIVWVSDSDAQNFVHWLVFDIPPGESGLTAGISEEPILGDGAHQGKNGFGHFGYGPPCPPENQTHHYVFRVYALDATLDLTPGASAADVFGAIRGHIVGYGKLTTTYLRPKS